MDAEVVGGGQRSAPLANLYTEISDLVERVQQSVVEVRNGNRGAGAGVVQDASGRVLTNAHVVAEAGQERRDRSNSRRRRSRRRGSDLTVVTRDGREFRAEVIESDPTLDLALLSFVGKADEPPTDLTAARFGDSDALRAGGLVFAVGHPWGRLGAATAGVVGDRLHRERPGVGVAYIRSDVALAPGNSGGPLLNARGEVVGINAMIFGNAAISIPSNAVKAWLSEPVSETAIRRPEVKLGVEVLSVVPGSREQLTKPGLVVAGVRGGSPAEKVGLMVGDVLLGANSQPLRDPQDLLKVLASIRTDAGSTVHLEVRRGSKASVFDVDLRARGPERAA